MGEVLDFVAYKQRKQNAEIEDEWDFLDQVLMNVDDTRTVTLTLSDENGNIMWSSNEDT